VNFNIRMPLHAALLAAALSFSLRAETSAAQDHLAGNTVLIVRHAEKPLIGRELTREGEARANAYVHYFEPFREDGLNIKINALYSGSDSPDSVRPRLTLEPLSRATGLPLDSHISTKDPDSLVTLLRTQPHGDHPLIAWRHGSVPTLLKAFGASPDIIPGGKWPDDTYDWVIILIFDSAGHLQSQRLIHENLTIP
jgi:hypothetical protein